MITNPPKMISYQITTEGGPTHAEGIPIGSYLAVRKDLQSFGKGHKYVVDHLPTGFQIGIYSMQKTAKEVAKKFDEVFGELLDDDQVNRVVDAMRAENQGVLTWSREASKWADFASWERSQGQKREADIVESAMKSKYQGNEIYWIEGSRYGQGGKVLLISKAGTDVFTGMIDWTGKDYDTIDAQVYMSDIEIGRVPSNMPWYRFSSQEIARINDKLFYVQKIGDKAALWNERGSGGIRESDPMEFDSVEEAKAFAEKSVKKNPVDPVDFFYKHAGCSYGEGETKEQGHKRSAEALAAAEEYAEDHDWKVEWGDDPSDPKGQFEYDEDVQAIYDGSVEWLTAVLKDAEGNVLASLGGIAIAKSDRSYGRVIEAELALEAMPSKNPTTGLTAKGRRMEKHVKASGSAYAPSAVVHAAAKRGVPGLVKKNPNVDVDDVIVLNPGDAPDAAGSALGLWGGRGKLWLFQFGAVGTSYVAYWDVGHYGLEGSLEEVAGYLADNMPGHIMKMDDPELKSLIMDVLKEQYPKKSWDDFTEDVRSESWAQNVEQEAFADLTYTESGYLTSYEWWVDEIDPGSEMFHRLFDKSMEEDDVDEDDEDLLKKIDQVEAKLGKKTNPTTSLTYGQLPPRKAFTQKVTPDMPFYADLKGEDKRVADHVGYDGGKLDADELYDLLQALIHHWNDGDEAAGDLASGIMTVVGYEWI